MAAGRALPSIAPGGATSDSRKPPQMQDGGMQVVGMHSIGDGGQRVFNRTIGQTPKNIPPSDSETFFSEKV